MPRVIVVAGVASGVGKTTVTLGLLEAFRRRGLTAQAFKVGPDFIDPGLHRLVTGRPSYNLDGWMCGRSHAMAAVQRYAADADVAVVEGVMGCFDGVDGTSETGSTAEMAKWLAAPVVLVLDASAQARSAAAVALGFERFDPALRVAGVIVNRVAGEAHGRAVLDALGAAIHAVPLGALPLDGELTLPERHLGLVTAIEGPLTDARRARLGEAIEKHVDLDRLLALASPMDMENSGATGAARIDAPPVRDTQGCAALPVRLAGVGAVPEAPSHPCAVAPRIGVARDAAFQFYYEENLALLRDAGAELVFWSPIADARVPDVDGLYLGGGYPELHARDLAGNRATRAGVRAFAASGRPVFAECGGLMYLADALEDAEGCSHPMVGVLPTTVRMRSSRLTLGYTEVVVASDGPLGEAGAIVRGHEFHRATMDPVPTAIARTWRLRAPGGGERDEGYRVGSTLLTWVHLHLASNPTLATRFVAACAGAPRA